MSYMSWTNYHGHCNYCDGHADMEEYVIEAIKIGMKSIAFSSHAPVPFDCFWTMKSERIGDYFKDIDVLKKQYKDQIDILTSLEIDYIPEVTGTASPVFKDAKLDFKIGSIHFIDAFSDGKPWNIDGSKEDFLKGVNEIFNKDVKAAVIRFWELSREMILTQKIDIIGHVDKIKMHNMPDPLFNETDDWYVEEFEKTLDLISKEGVIVEINTKSYERNGLLFPGIDLFRNLHNKNIAVTINSDSHYPDKQIVGFSFVADQLLKAGYKTLKEFVNGKWIDIPFTKEGLLWDEKR